MKKRGAYCRVLLFTPEKYWLVNNRLQFLTIHVLDAGVVSCVVVDAVYQFGAFVGRAQGVFWEYLAAGGEGVPLGVGYIIEEMLFSAVSVSVVVRMIFK